MRQVTAGVALVLLIFSAGLAGEWEVFSLQRHQHDLA